MACAARCPVGRTTMGARRHAPSSKPGRVLERAAGIEEEQRAGSNGDHPVEMPRRVAASF